MLNVRVRIWKDSKNMAYKRKAGSYKRNAKRRRTRRRMSKYRITVGTPNRPLSINRAVCSYNREVPLGGNITVASGTSSVTFAYSFTLTNMCPNRSEFSELFDQYRLRCIVWKMRMIQPPEANNTPTTLQYYPDAYVTVDHDDANQPADVEEVMQYGKVKSGILYPNKWFKYKCYPTPNTPVYQGLVSSGYAKASNKLWLDLASPGISYYGIKGAIDCRAIGNLAANLNVEARIHCYWEFKNAR